MLNENYPPPPPKKKESYNPSHHEKIRVGVHQTYRLLLHVNDVGLTQFCIPHSDHAVVLTDALIWY